MTKNFLQDLYQQHQATPRVPSSATVCRWLDGLLSLLFPALADTSFSSFRGFQHQWATSRQALYAILETLGDQLPDSPVALEETYMASVPEVHRLISTDAAAIFAGDPAANSLTEVIRSYPGFYAIAVYRLAHRFCQLGVPLIPRILTEHAHTQTGVDIHPAAQIGERFCIDHGTGVVLGETVVIGENVKIYQGVTLGALSVQKTLAKIKRHPTIEDGVVIYANATILGGDTVIGKGAVIGGNTWITKSVAAGDKVYYRQDLET
ncbi:MAG: serine acetyltransferase [Bacteroidota bacterium]